MLVTDIGDKERHQNLLEVNLTLSHLPKRLRKSQK